MHMCDDAHLMCELMSVTFYGDCLLLALINVFILSVIKNYNCITTPDICLPPNKSFHLILQLLVSC